MKNEVKVPSMGESITTGMIAEWHVGEGDFVKPGQVLYDLETDKITVEGSAEAAGRISLKAAENEEVEIGQVIALIDDEAEAPEEKSGKPEAPKGKREKAIALAATETGSNVAPAPPPPAAAVEEKEKPGKQALPLSPSVRRIAAETGIDPGTVRGTGKGGRVIKGDILAALDKPPPQPLPSSLPPPSSAPPFSAPCTRKKMSPLRRRIAERLVAAQQTAAILTTFNEVDMSRVIALRKKYREAFLEKYGCKLGFMSFFVKAVVRALKERPSLNARIEGEEIIQNHYYDIGVAVSTEKGLLVPVVRGCDRLGCAEIEREIIQFANKARQGKIAIEDLQGGVFTISNGGVFGSMLSTPILNQPQSGILGMHTITDRPVVADGQIVIRPMMYLALSYDHRLVDGSEAVGFLLTVKKVVEDPSRLFLEI